MRKLLLTATVLLIAGVSFGQWKLTGNAGVTTSNFVGTTDAAALRFRVKNTPSGIIDSASGNTALGHMALFSVTPSLNNGNNNTALGAKALRSNTTGYNNTASGQASLRSNTTGYNNTANGFSSLFSNTTGSGNTSIGVSSLAYNTSGYSNTASGESSLAYNTTGYNNTASGTASLVSNTSGYSNTASGFKSLYSNTIGSNNTAVGYFSLYFNSGGLWNSAFGASALYNNSSGSGNTAIGDSAMLLNLVGSNNTMVGYKSDVSSGGLVNATALGFGAVSTGTNCVRIGNGSVISIGGQVSWTNLSDGRIKKNIKSDVPGLNFIKLLNPVTYNYDLKKQHALEGRTDNSQDYPGKDDIEKISFSGFIAQEVDEAAKKIGYTFSGVDKSGNIMGLRYSDFVVPVVKSVQELAKADEAKQNKIDQLEKTNEELKKENELIKNRLEKIEQLLSKYTGSNQVETLKKQTASLEQNIPNPFNGSTSIGFSLPEKNSIAYINIYAQNGALAKSVKVNGEGRSTITLNRNELAAGVYNYVLVVNGKPADSRQMIIE